MTSWPSSSSEAGSCPATTQTPKPPVQDAHLEDEASLPAQADEADQAGGSVARGFYRHSVWVNRHRTAMEQRAHQGGQGATRQSRRDARRDEWLSGNWKPAWLKQYQREKAERDRARDAASTLPSSAGTLPTSSAPRTCATSPTPGTSTTSPTTSTASTSSPAPSSPALPTASDPPPEASATDLETDESQFMQLLGSERARLQEAGIRPIQLDRLDALMDHLAHQQDQGNGAECRWGLRCCLRRVDRAAGLNCNRSFNDLC